MLRALLDGFSSTARRRGLVFVVWLSNVGLALLLALPLARQLERDLKQTDAAPAMMYGFDHSWWSGWSDAQSGWTRSFRPDIFGVGFVFRNVDLLLKGSLPAGLFRPFAAQEDDEEANDTAPPLDGVILGLGAAYMVIQCFLAGGLLGVFRGQQGSWTVRSLLHGSGFYFGRMFRVAVVALVSSGLVFLVHAPLGQWMESRARDSVSETAAQAWLFSRAGLLLLSLLFVHMTSSYAKIIVVLEERSSAVLAFLSSLGFCLRHLLRTGGHYLAVVALGLVLVGIWNSLDSRWMTVGYRTQLVSLALGQALVLGRIGLRLALLGGQMALYKRLSSPSLPDASHA